MAGESIEVLVFDEHHVVVVVIVIVIVVVLLLLLLLSLSWSLISPPSCASSGADVVDGRGSSGGNTWRAAAGNDLGPDPRDCASSRRSTRT